ncbi:MAG TPA: SPOR domain-containing protein [Pseudomonadales bacterium]|nr:SPOR domain-containing protein [Pseudomonadales bacterium]
MSHDFARSQRLKKESARKPARKKSGGVPSWLWVLVGTLVGCLIMFLVYLSGMAPQLPNLKPAAQQAVAPAEQKSSEPAAPPKRVSPVFEFYTKLPEGGQPVTDIQPGTQPPPANTAVPTPATPAGTANPDPIQQLLAEKEAAKTEPKPAAVPPEPVKPEPAKTEAAKAEAPKVTSGGRYLQAGVFRSKAEVDKLKARIALLGMKANVQSVTNSKGETLQKVLVGPFNSAEGMNDAKIILDGNGVNTIPVK